MNARVAVLLVLVVAVALYRVLPHLPNVTPVAAMALFAGTYFADRRLALLLPVAALLISDLFLGFYASMPFVYIAFAITVGLGVFLSKRINAINVAASGLVGSILFFIITNFGTWLVGDMYPHDLAGLMQAYVAGIPFYRYTLLGDLFFIAVFFGGFSLIQQHLSQSHSRAA